MFLKKIGKKCVYICALSLFVLNKSYALEVGGALHKGNDSGSSAISLHMLNQITKSSKFNWSLSYNKLNKLKVEWNNRELDFSTNTIDATILYRHKLKSYNAFFKKVSIDYQAGVSFNLTDNKFYWPELDEEKYFSKKKDINAVIALSANYKLNKSTSMHIGLKHLPRFSNFNGISTVFIGLNYKIGNRSNY